LKPGDNCIIHKANQSIKLVQFENDMKEDIELTDKDEWMYKDFVYTDEVIEECNELELSIYIGMILILFFVIFTAAGILACIISRNYKKKYELLTNEATPRTSE